MGSLLKNLYSESFYNRFSDIATVTIPSFSRQLFLQQIYQEEFQDMELKERMKHTADVLHLFLPADYVKAVELIKDMITSIRKQSPGEEKLEWMIFPQYIETYGLNDFEHSVDALEFITQFISCEFAVRPFIRKYGDAMINRMIQWSQHENYKVRRLASEGSRPRLPWAMALPLLKKDPAPVLPILENLKNDPSEWVRRSVANHLNDIAKNNPDIMLRIAFEWKGISKETDAVIKHGSRTLLKQGHADILRHYNISSTNIDLSNFIILTPAVMIGGILQFTFSVTNKQDVAQTVRLEYAVYYKRSNGKYSKKVFKISERVYQPNEQAHIKRAQKFVLITTRKFYAGDHRLSVIINGEEKEMKDFEVLSAELLL